MPGPYSFLLPEDFRRQHFRQNRRSLQQSRSGRSALDLPTDPLRFYPACLLFAVSRRPDGSAAVKYTPCQGHFKMKG